MFTLSQRKLRVQKKRRKFFFEGREQFGGWAEAWRWTVPHNAKCWRRKLACLMPHLTQLRFGGGLSWRQSNKRTCTKMFWTNKKWTDDVTAPFRWPPATSVESHASWQSTPTQSDLRHTISLPKAGSQTATKPSTNTDRSITKNSGYYTNRKHWLTSVAQSTI